MSKTFLILAATAASFLLSASVCGQSLTVTSNKVTYTRTGKDVPDHKKEFTVDYPVLSGDIPAESIKKIEKAIDHWSVFEMTLEENLNDYTWLYSADYEVNFNKNNIFDITLTIDGSAAYPYTAVRHFVFDMRTGKLVSIGDVFAENEMPELLEMIKKEMRKQESELDSDSNAYLDEKRTSEVESKFHPRPDELTFEKLEGFTVSDKGVTFIYNYNYAHVAQFYQPEGRFFFSFSQLKPFIDPNGLLQSLVR